MAVVVSDEGHPEGRQMPPLEGVAGQMIVSFFPGGAAAMDCQLAAVETGTESTSSRLDASADIKQRVAALTASGTLLAK